MRSGGRSLPYSCIVLKVYTGRRSGFLAQERSWRRPGEQLLKAYSASQCRMMRRSWKYVRWKAKSPEDGAF